MIVTIWLRRVVSSDFSTKLEHNHFSEGWNEDEDRPTPSSPLFENQKRDWERATWEKVKGYLIVRKHLALPDKLIEIPDMDLDEDEVKEFYSKYEEIIR